MYHLYLVARRREPEAPRFAAEITLRARAAARDRERELLRAEPHEERAERPRLRPRLPRFVARARTRRARARALEI